MRKLRTLCVLTSVVGAILMFASSAFASTTTLHPFIPDGISSSNQQAAFNTVMSRASVDSSMETEMAHLSGASTFVATDYKSVGYQNGAPGSSNSGVSDTGVVTATADTTECNVHSLMFVIMNTQTGVKLFFCVSCGNLRITVVHSAPKPHPFAKGTVLKVNRQYVRLFNAACPGTGQKVVVKVTSWVRTIVRAKTWGKVTGSLTVRVNASFTQNLVNQTVKVTCSSLPTPQSGSCNVVNSPGGIACSNITYVNVCGTMVAYTGDQQNITAWINNYVADHCAPTVTTTVSCNQVGASNFGSPGVCIFPPPQVCQDKAANNFGGPLPCTFPPSQFTATGSTSVQSQKTVTAPCPAPNQGIVKSATSDVATLTSPTFTGHGTTQTAADQDLVNQENTWKSSNQAAVDSQAQLQANARLNTALQSCPTTSPSVDVSFNDVQEVNTNESRANTCATVTTNLSMTVQVTADHGSWSGVSPVSVNGSQLVCGTYTGPSETGSDVWHVKVFFNGVLIKDATHTITITPVPNPNI